MATLFHSRASHRFRKNVIMGITDHHGHWREDLNDIAGVLLNFYQVLFTTSDPILHQRVLDQIPQVISNDMNQELICKFEVWEVVQALKQMSPMKAPRPNGMPPLFFQHFWPMIEGYVTQSVLSWLKSGTLPHLVNHTFITLVQKKVKSCVCVRILPYQFMQRSLQNFLKSTS